MDGTPTNNLLTGTTGYDLMHGYDGNDVLKGGADSDWVYGDNGADNMLGEAGDDMMFGGAGGDALSGGTGADTFWYLDVGDSTSTAYDLIKDYNASQGDKLDLSVIDADSGTVGDQAFTVVSGFTNQAGQLVLAYSAAANLTTVSGDVDGDGVADLVITMTGNVTATGWVL